MTTTPVTKDLILRCGNCGRVWTAAAIILPMNADVFCDALDAVQAKGCACGSHDLLIEDWHEESPIKSDSKPA